MTDRQRKERTCFGKLKRECFSPLQETGSRLWSQKVTGKFFSDLRVLYFTDLSYPDSSRSDGTRLTSLAMRLSASSSALDLSFLVDLFRPVPWVPMSAPNVSSSHLRLIKLTLRGLSNNPEKARGSCSCWVSRVLRGSG